jgi:hypothetical protein
VFGSTGSKHSRKIKDEYSFFNNRSFGSQSGGVASIPGVSMATGVSRKNGTRGITSRAVSFPPKINSQRSRVLLIKEQRHWAWNRRADWVLGINGTEKPGMEQRSEIHEPLFPIETLYCLGGGASGRGGH